MNILVVGCGRTGVAFSQLMFASGHRVTIIEHNKDALDRLSPSFGGQIIVGNGMDRDTLERARIRDVDLFAALTEGDNRNLMAAQIAREVYHIPKVIAKVNDPVRAQVFRQHHGIYTICYGMIGAHMMRAYALDEAAGSVEECNQLPRELTEED